MTLESFLQKLKSNPESIEFKETMDIIDSLYDFTRHHSRMAILLMRRGKTPDLVKFFCLHDFIA